MKRLLSAENRDFLAQLAWSPVLLAFDYDGTLAPIVTNREAAVMRPSTTHLLAEVAKVYPVAIISGRSRDDVASRLGAAEIKYVVGNHGLEPGGDLDACEAEMVGARPILEKELASVPGVDIEDKRYSIAVHYRRSRNKALARSEIHGTVKKLPTPMRVVPGKQVVNVVPARAPDKGDALLRLRDQAGASVAFYVGDDVTDEDVFRLDQPGRVVGVRVGESADSYAKYFLKDQREIDNLLRRLRALRKEKGKGVRE